MKKIILAATALLAWFALIAQFYINMNSRLTSVPELIIRYFSYFTIDTNLIVAVYCSTLLLKPGSALGRFFSRQTAGAAITVYIVIVGIVYNVILRSIWDPQGLQKVVDELLHVITPVLFLLYWLIFVSKNELKWKDSFGWLMYPALYGAFVLTRGYFSDPAYYPYPFIDMSKIGIEKGVINTIVFTMIFFIASLVFIGAGKLMSRSKH